MWKGYHESYISVSDRAYQQIIQSIQFDLSNRMNAGLKIAPINIMDNILPISVINDKNEQNILYLM